MHFRHPKFRRVLRAIGIALRVCRIARFILKIIEFISDIL